ncbi:MAG TPA: prolipoprotein diacylglyceryl transferase, partial [Mycobacterium sp.]|nr:prolipoprotein diacylglyceryl transferase [Mycobacterium sp.]
MTTIILASFPSPSQGVWHLGPIPIRAYALCILVGVIVALFIGDRRWAERGGEKGTVFDIALPAIIFGLIGGRLYHVLTDWETYFGPGGAGFLAAFKIQEGGLGIWGAVALGGVGAWIGCRHRGIPLPAFGDAIAPGIILAQAIGRIGNYFNQELFGRDTTLPWGLEIFERVDANGAVNYLNGVSTGRIVQVVHPTFLYELIWNLLVFALLIWVDRRYRIGHGRLFALYVAAYCFGRFWIELMRSDMATHIAGIRINSFVSVFVFIGAVVYIMVAPKGREDPSELRGDVAVEAKAARAAEESRAEEVTKELAAVAATTGVVAAAKVAGDREDEDEAEADKPDAEEKSEAEDSDEPEAEPIAEAEQLTKDVAEAPAEDIAEAEAFAQAGEEADQAEQAVGGVGAVEGDEVTDEDEAAEDGSEEPAEAADAGEQVGGVGVVEGDEVAEVEEVAPEVHEAAVENAEEAAAVADEVADEDEAAEEASEEPADEAGEEASEEPADEAADIGEQVGGVGVVEGD